MGHWRDNNDERLKKIFPVKKLSQPLRLNRKIHESQVRFVPHCKEPKSTA